MTGAVAEVSAGLLIAPALLLGAALLHGPSGYAALLVPRRRRAARRYRLAHRSRRPRTRAQQRSGRFPGRMARQIRFIDRNRCVNCRQNYYEVRLRGDSLQCDHAIPWAWGGLTCIWNGFLLCGRCNKVKGGFFTENGRVLGRGFAAHVSRHDGAAIYRKEMRRRRSPDRMARVLMAVLAVR
jgi:5-methylcytosine-specific restriction endonuclease McrA